MEHLTHLLPQLVQVTFPGKAPVEMKLEEFFKIYFSDKYGVERQQQESSVNVPKVVFVKDFSYTVNVSNSIVGNYQEDINYKAGESIFEGEIDLEAVIEQVISDNKTDFVPKYLYKNRWILYHGTKKCNLICCEKHLPKHVEKIVKLLKDTNDDWDLLSEVNIPDGEYEWHLANFQSDYLIMGSPKFDPRECDICALKRGIAKMKDLSLQYRIRKCFNKIYDNWAAPRPDGTCPYAEWAYKKMQEEVGF